MSENKLIANPCSSQVDELHRLYLSPQGAKDNVTAVPQSSSDSIVETFSQMEEESVDIAAMRQALRDYRETVKIQNQRITVLEADAQHLQKRLEKARAETVRLQDMRRLAVRAFDSEFDAAKTMFDTYTGQLEEDIRGKDVTIQNLTQAQTLNLTDMEELKEALRGSQETVQTQDEQITVLEADVSDLQEQVQGARAETVSVQETLQSAERAFQLELRQERQRSDTYISMLEEKMVSLKNQITNSQEAIREKDVVIEELTQAQTLNLREMEELKEALRGNEEFVKLKDQQITVLEADVSDLQKQVQGARAETVSVQETLQSAERAFQLELREERQKSDMSTRELEEKMVSLKNQITNSQEAIREKDVIQELTQAQTLSLTVIEELKEALSGNEESVKLKDQQITVLEADVSDLQEQVQGARAETVSVQETLQSENRALQLELLEERKKRDMSTRELEEKMFSLNTVVTDSQEEIRGKDLVIQQLTQAQTLSLTDMEELKEALHDSQEMVKSQNQQITVLEAGVSDLQEQVQGARAETVSVQETLQSTERAFQLELRQERQKSDMSTRELEEKMVSLKNQITNSQEAIREKDVIQELTQAQTLSLTVIEELKEALRGNEESVKLRDQQITVLEADVSDLQEQVQGARAETVSVQETLQSAERALQLELREERQKSDTYFSMLEVEMVSLKNQVRNSQEAIREKDVVIQELTQAQTLHLTDMEELKEALCDSQEIVKSQNQQITVLEADVSDLQEQVQGARAETVSVQETLQSAERAFQLELREERKKRDMSTRELEEKMVSLKNQITNSQEAIREKDLVIQELTQAQTLSLTDMEKLKEALRDCQELVQSQNQQITVLEADVSDLQEQVQGARPETVSVQETLQSENRVLQLELRVMKDTCDTCVELLEKKILTLKVEIREFQEDIRQKDVIIQELSHFESLAESKDAEIKELRLALYNHKKNEISLAEQNNSLVEEVARLEDQTEKQNGANKNLKTAVQHLQHHMVEAESLIWCKDELVTQQTREIADMKELTEELYLHISDLKKTTRELKKQLDTKQEEEILAGVGLFLNFSERLPEAHVVETPVVETPAVETPVVETPAFEAPVVEAPVVEAPVVETPAVETPVVEAPAFEAPVVETPVVETPVVEAPVVKTPVVETPAFEAPNVEGQTRSWWRRCARGLQKVGLCVGITAVHVLVPLSILASYNICSSDIDDGLLHPFFNIEHVRPATF